MEAKDSLMADPGDRFELVLTNPPFGKKKQHHRFQRRWQSRQRKSRLSP
ncbi:hypothetical protein [Nostoc sp. LPT]|nr:hypothetical protein [Nostoc sp. LPT]